MNSKLLILILSFLTIKKASSKELKHIINDLKYMTGMTKGKPCKQNILRSYGLKGYDTSRKIRINFCPRIRNSCCQVRDQLFLYRNWVLGDEEDSLTERLEYYMDTYSELIDLTDIAYKKALKLKKFLDNKKLGNCKIITKRLLDFKPKKLNLKLRAAIMQMYEFFQTAFSGFYCTICDANMQEFIDVKNEKFIFKKSFCRSLLKNTFPVLMYFHFDYIQYVNLISKFMTSCDYRGKFFKTPVPPQYIFKISHQDVKLLNTCKKYRNNKELWFRNCEKICNKFSPTKMNKYFIPHMRQISKYNKFLKRQIKFLEKEEQMKGFVNMKRKKKKIKKPVKDLFTKFSKPNIFKSSINAVTKVEKFKSNFENEKGIDLFYNGILVNFDVSIYNSLKHLEKRSLYNVIVANSMGGSSFTKVYNILYLSSMIIFFLF